MKGLQFTKMAASGNDFIVIDNRDERLSGIKYRMSDVAERLCTRKFSVGADGLLLIETSQRGAFRMRIYNPDGSEVEMCGNGLRCVALYAVENGIATKAMKVETAAGLIEAEVVGLRVRLRLTDPKAIKLNRKIKIGKKALKFHSIKSGVSHAVSFVNNVDRVNVERLGSRIRFHRAFRPEGTNVNFVTVLGPKEISVRTYERGVEGETYACGTGAAASAVIAGLVCGLKPHIDVATKSGEKLRVYFDLKGETVKDVYLEGEARVIYNGRMDYV